MVEIRTPQTASEWETYYDLRFRILREPLQQPRGSERNEGDATGQHFALYSHGMLQAIARLDQVDENASQVRFVAVESHLQGNGIGQQLMQAVETACAEQKVGKLVLHARDYAVNFYEKLGYTLIGPSYKLFDVLQHYLMEKKM
jgi:predicted GNAT family N-acyltransferase